MGDAHIWLAWLPLAEQLAFKGLLQAGT